MKSDTSPSRGSFRPVRTSDLDALIDLLKACDEVDIGHPDTDAEDVEWRWRTKEFDPERDSFVAEEDGRPIVYGWVFEELADVRVHPAHRGKGWGSALLPSLEQRAREQGPTKAGDDKPLVLKQNVTNKQPAARSFLESHGYAPSHHYSRMEATFEDPPPRPEPPAGITVTSFDIERDARALYDAYTAAWANYEGIKYVAEPFERFMDDTQGSDFHPDLWLIAWEKGSILGLNQMFSVPPDGVWVHRLGTVPEARGRGIGRLLLRWGFSVAFEHGYRTTALTVSSRNVSEARHLYESEGMTEVLRYENFKKELT